MNKIIKVVDRKRVEKIIDNKSDSEIFEQCSTHDIIYFICNVCNFVGNRIKSKFIEDDFVCKKCKLSSISKEERKRRLKLNQEKQRKKFDGLLYFQTEEFKKKSEATSLKKYGHSSPNSSDEIKEKKILSYIEKYGVDNPMKLKDISDKLRKPKKNKPIISKEETEQKRIFTNLKNRGVKYSGQDPIVIEKIKKTNFRNHEGKYFFQTEKFILENKTRNLNKQYDILKTEKSGFSPLFTKEEYNGTIGFKYPWRCLECSSEFISSFVNGIPPRCPKCSPVIKSYSQAEKDIRVFISDELRVLTSKIRPENVFEIDIFCNDYSIGFEYDGLYYHSTDKIGKDYHLNKTNFFKERGISVYHIFEDEWLNKKEIVKSIIKTKLNKFDKTFYGRKCTIKEINYNVAKSFVDENHIQGYSNSCMRVGLFFEEELISVMTFGKSRFDKKYEWELIRFCNKLGYKVVGGAGKLFNYFKNEYNPSNIISYCDLRYFDGIMYEKIGMKFSHISSPNYFYFLNNKIRFSRNRFQKHKLKNILETFDENKTETENMLDNKYLQIHDCGNKVFVWNK